MQSYKKLWLYHKNNVQVWVKGLLNREILANFVV